MTETNEVGEFNCPTCGCTDLPARELGESCEYVFGIGDVGECAEGLVCMCVGPCADPMIADYPSTCIEERPSMFHNCKSKKIRYLTNKGAKCL